MAAESPKRPIVWRVSARRDFEDILDFLAERSPQAALRIGERITGRVEQLSVFPYIAPPANAKLEARLMAIPGTPYLVVYRVRPNDVIIDAVFHGAQDRRP